MNYKNVLLGSSCLLIFLAGALDSKAQTLTNGSFEAASYATNGAGYYKVDPTASGWIYSTGNAGMAKDGSRFDTNGVYTPYGSQFAFLDPSMGGGAASISYKIVTPATASQLYTIYFASIQAVTNAQPQSVTITITGTNQNNNLGTYIPVSLSSGSWGSYQTPAIYLNPGTSTITFMTPATGGAVLVDSVSLSQSTTQSNSLAINGLLNVSGNIDFGTFEGGGYPFGGVGPGALLSYSDNTNGSAGLVELTAAGPAASYLWQDNGDGAMNFFAGAALPNNKMLLDGSNNLTIYGTNGSAGIVMNPNTGGITVSGTGSGIKLADGTVLSGAANLRSTALYNSAGTQLLGFDTNGNLTSSANSVSFGSGTAASGQYAVALGQANNASGYASAAWGGSNVASGPYTTAFGLGSRAVGTLATAFGQNSYAAGWASFAAGGGSQALWLFSTAMGGASASGYFSIGQGQYSVASGVNSVALGYNAMASGAGGVSIGGITRAIGTNSTAFGVNDYAVGNLSLVFGLQTVGRGYDSTAFGIYTTALGDYSTAFGYSAYAPSYASVAFGQYNVGISSSTGATNWVSSDPVLEIGNGTSAAHSNAVTIFKSGEIRSEGLVQSQAGFRTPPTGDLSMGSYTNGNNPATLNPQTGLLYPGGN